MQLARIVGGFGAIYTGAVEYLRLREAGIDQGRAASRTILGYDYDEAGVNTSAEVIGRLMRTYWPALAGEAAHQILGNPRGAFNSGIGMKLNRHTPKGLNL